MKDRLRVSAKKDKGEILAFTVQYEAFFENRWCPIIRYDTAHGFAHIDLMYPDGKVEKQPIYFPDYNNGIYPCYIRPQRLLGKI